MLEELRIRYRDDANVLAKTVAQFSGTRLKRLHINYCNRITEKFASLLAKNCTDLKFVNHDGTGTRSNIATGYLTRINSLRNIDLFNCRYILPEHITRFATKCDFFGANQSWRS